jgi:hypothetical protein
MLGLELSTGLLRSKIVLFELVVTLLVLGPLAVSAWNLHFYSCYSLSYPLGGRNRRLSSRSGFLTDLSMSRRKGSYDSYDEDEYYSDEDDTLTDARLQRRRAGGNGSMNVGGQVEKLDIGRNLPSSFGAGSPGLRLPERLSKALLAGIFVLGIGTGVTVDSAINTNPKDLASRDAVDRNAPNARLCSQYGASAMAFDQRIFVSFDPFNVYVAQADVKPACVLFPANVVPILRERKLLSEKEVQACKANMNTWAFVGDLDDAPQLSCVYQSDDAQNEFLSDPKIGIGEDYLDDDRFRGGTGKLVKENAKKRSSGATSNNPNTNNNQ